MAQVFQALDEAALKPCTTIVVEVVDAEILVHLGSGEQAIDDDQDRVAECHGGLLLAAAGSKPSFQATRPVLALEPVLVILDAGP